MAVLVCGRSGLWPFRFVVVPVCGRSWFVAVSVCGRSGLWPFRFVAVSVCGRSGLWPFRFVAVSVCGRLGFGRFGLWPLWPESLHTIKSAQIETALLNHQQMTIACTTSFTVVQPVVSDHNWSYYQSWNWSTNRTTIRMVAQPIARSVARLHTIHRAQSVTIMSVGISLRLWDMLSVQTSTIRFFGNCLVLSNRAGWDARIRCRKWRQGHPAFLKWRS